jgi:GT2 family glycosyltransferase
MKTTVVIPNYNGRNYLQDCLTSLLEGSEVPAIIVVDNGSADESAAMVKERFPMVKLIALPENRGFSAAVNIGIHETGTEYVFLLNNDTVVLKDTIEELEAAMERHPKAFSVAAKMLQMKNPELIDSAGDFYCALGWAFARGKDRKTEAFSKETSVFSACAGAALYRKAVFEKIGDFDENHFAYLEDLDIGYRARIFGYQNWYAPKAKVYHVGSGTSGSRYNQFKIRYSSRNNIYLIYKNMPFLQIVLNLPFLLVGFGAKILFFASKGFGREYLAGIKNGFQISRKNRKVKFSMRNFPRYIQLQVELWINIFRRFAG